jgi:hypothetical protein
MPVTTTPKNSPKRARHPALRLFEKWRREAVYDAKAWPRVRRALEKNRLSNRPAFDD